MLEVQISRNNGTVDFNFDSQMAGFEVLINNPDGSVDYLDPIYILFLHHRKQRNYFLNPKTPVLPFFHFHLYDLKYYF